MAKVPKTTLRAIRIDSRTYEILRNYKELVGVPIARTIREAVTDWLETIGATRLRAMGYENWREIFDVDDPNDTGDPAA